MRTRIGIATDPDLWRRFRIACLEHNVSASQAISTLMREQLTRWDRRPRRYTGHQDDTRTPSTDKGN